jgi:hypothetical protein
MSQNEIKDIVLVHGGLVDGSGWEGVYKILRKMATRSQWFKIRPSRSEMMLRPPSERLPIRTDK